MRGKYFKAAALKDWAWRWAKRQDAGGCQFAGLYEPEHYRPATIIRDHSHSGVVCLAASLAPPGGSAEATDILTSLLVAGTPILVWPEADSTGRAGPVEIYQALKAFVQRGALETLPERVHDHRRRRLDPTEGPPADWRLCLLWDDPERLPPSCHFQLVPPTR
jgi:hypothetical protein